MFIFPFIYITFFILAIKSLADKNSKGIVPFIVFALPIYTTAVSITNMYGFTGFVGIMQSLKDITIISYLLYLIYNLNRKIYFHSIDYLVVFLYLYIFIYIFLPLGSYGFYEKLIAFKSLCFYPLVYFTGRLIDVRKINISEIFHYIFLLSILSACVLAVEVVTYTHLQTYTGYAEYISHFFGQEPSGAYGLSWTFEIENGMKRFASFYAAPLDHAAATLISIAALAAFATNNNNSIRFNRFTLITLFSTFFSISFALSRASFASYFIIIYTYAYITKKDLLLKLFHYGVLVFVLFVLFLSVKSEFFDFIISSIKFTNGSSVGHLIEWVNGIQSIISHPLGIGLGESGRLSGLIGTNTGGENEFIILGVQVGVIALITYIAIYIKIIKVAAKTIRTRTGRTRKLGIFIILIKIGLFIPLFTAEVETYIYISYLVWFLSGIFMSLVTEKANLPYSNKHALALPSTI